MNKPPDENISMLDASHPVHNNPLVSLQSGNNGAKMLVSWDSDTSKKRRHSQLDDSFDASGNAEVQYTVDNLYELGDNNILPCINKDGTCSRCHSQMSSISVREEMIECSCCFKKFHALCSYLADDAKKNKLLLLPGKTELKQFNKLMERNGQYYGGEFGGFKCRSCVSLSTLKENRFRCDRLNMIESLLIEQKPLQGMLEQVIKRLDALESAYKSNLPNVSSVGFQGLSGSAAVVQDVNLVTSESVARVKDSAQSRTLSHATLESTPSFASAVATTVQRSSEQVTPFQLPSTANTTFGKNQQTPNVTKNLFRVRAKALPEEPTHIERIFARHSAKGKGVSGLKRYNCRSRGRDGMDLLFSSYEEAVAEFNSVSDALKDEKVTISKPEIMNVKKAYLVGLDNYHFENNDLVLEEILDVSQNTWLSEHIKSSCFKVLEVKPCLKDKYNYRATLQLSDEVLNSIMDSHGGKIRVGYLNCSVYPFTPHFRCQRCQSHGHKKDSCKLDHFTCAKCAGNHSTTECTSDIQKCINCFNDANHKDGCMSHSADSNHCPVFLAARIAERKRKAASKK